MCVIQVTLIPETCFDCHRPYATDNRGDSRCPYCVNKDIREVNLARRKAEKAASALRGAVTRLRRQLAEAKK